MPHIGQTPPDLGVGATIFGVGPPLPTFGVGVFGVAVFGGQSLAVPTLATRTEPTLPTLASIPDLMPPNLLP